MDALRHEVSQMGYSVVLVMSGSEVRDLLDALDFPDRTVPATGSRSAPGQPFDLNEWRSRQRITEEFLALLRRYEE